MGYRDCCNTLILHSPWASRYLWSLTEFRELLHVLPERLLRHCFLQAKNTIIICSILGDKTCELALSNYYLPTSFQSTSTETKRGCKLALEESDFVLRYSLKFRDKWLGRLTAVEYFQFSISITTFACWGLPISKSQGQCSLVYFGDRAGVDEEIAVHGCSLLPVFWSHSWVMLLKVQH